MTLPSLNLLLSTVVLGQVIKNLAILFLATLSHRVSILSLSPVYGSVPASATKLDVFLEYLIWLAAMLTYRRMSTLMDCLPIIGYLAPISQSILYQFSGTMGPFYGPLVDHLVTSWPILLMSLVINVNFIASVIFPKPKGTSPLNKGAKWISLESACIFTCAFVFKYVSVMLLRAVSLILARSPSMPDVITSRFGMHAVLSILWTSLARSRAAFWFGVLSSAYAMFFIVHMPTAQKSIPVNTALLGSNYALVARQESLTGYISVLDNLKEGFRVMRCDHSLLGGEWINKPEGHPARFNEPIYSIFVMLEAVRLIETQNPQASLKDVDVEKQALIV